MIDAKKEKENDITASDKNEKQIEVIREVRLRDNKQFRSSTGILEKNQN